jgi:hypothetical protein
MTRESHINQVVSDVLDNFCEENCEHRNDDIECNGADGLGHFGLICYQLLLTELKDVQASVQAKIEEELTNPSFEETL